MQRWISLLALFNFPSLFSEVVAPEFISLFHQFVKLTVLIFLIAWSIFSDCYLQPAMEVCGFSLHKKKLNALFTSISISNSTFKIIHCHLHVLKHTEKHASKYDVLQNNKQVNPSRKKYDWNLKTLLIVSIPYSDHMQTKHAKLFPQ